MAGRTALATFGQEDVFLSYDPEVTYFRECYSKKTRWTSRIDEVIFGPDSQYFGGETFVQLPTSGDIISKVYLKIQNPGVFGTSNILDSAGTLMIHYADLYIGSQLVDRQFGEFIEMKLDLEVPVSKQGALKKLIGKNLSNTTSGGLSTYTIDLPFYILKKGLPIFAIKDPIIVRIAFNPASTFCPAIQTAVQFDASLYVEYVYLDGPEKNYIDRTFQVYLNEHCQREEFFVKQGVTQVQCKTQFANPVKELFIVIQADSAQGYDYGTTDFLRTMSFEFNNVTHIPETVGTPTFLRILQPLEFHTRKPDRLFYIYSFSIDPQSESPTTHVNFSRILNQTFNFKLNSGISTNLYIRIYALAYNFVTIERGIATVLFSNYES
jgi:Major capsid protein N-terminus/Large eukaryotic DNA virus major capsid protein